MAQNEKVKNTPMQRGFIFSLDSFIALSLILVSIYSLFILVSVPKTFYNSHLQAYDIARDSINSLGNLEYVTTNLKYKGLSYLERIAINTQPGVYASPESSGYITKDALDPVIPLQYGYKVEAYDIKNSRWDTIYDTANDTTTQHNRNYRKLSATAQSLVAGYKAVPTPSGLADCGSAQSGIDQKDLVGDNFICDPNPNIAFKEGDVFVSVVRITVYI